MAQSSVQFHFGREEAKGLLSLLVVLGIMWGSLFGAAGALDWPLGWAFCGVYLATILLAMAWIWRSNPELFAARSKYQKGTKAWDAVVATATIIAYFAILPAAGLDFRLGATQPTAAMIAAGYLAFAGGFLGFTWAQSVNRHFEATVRIQTDRDHKVITTGPYAIVRHPGYVFASVMALGTGPALGSLWALAPAGVIVLLLVGRTLAEDATLKAELPGYADYATRVRQRWIPGVW